MALWQVPAAVARALCHALCELPLDYWDEPISDFVRVGLTFPAAEDAVVDAVHLRAKRGKWPVSGRPEEMGVKNGFSQLYDVFIRPDLHNYTLNNYMYLLLEAYDGEFRTGPLTGGA